MLSDFFKSQMCRKVGNDIRSGHTTFPIAYSIASQGNAKNVIFSRKLWVQVVILTLFVGPQIMISVQI